MATQACRSADNGAAFVARVEQETGLRLQIISPREEAQLSVAGCAALLDRSAEAALVVDVGGGLDRAVLGRPEADGRCGPSGRRSAPGVSIPIGVVTLAERFPEAEDRGSWFSAMVEHVKRHIAEFPHAEAMRPVFASGGAHLIGTSGAITSLARHASGAQPL